MVREGLKLVLQRMVTDPSAIGCEQIIECESFPAALEHVAGAGDIDLALLDLRMPGMNGVEGVSEFHERFPDVPIVVISGRYGREDILAAFDKGAAGFVPKNMSNEALTGAIRLVLSGERYVPPVTLSVTDMQFVSSHGTDDVLGETNPLRQLTNREWEVLTELIQGLQNKVIANNLNIREVTVKLHLMKIYRKLGVANRTQAVKTALDFGWADVA